MNNMKAKLWDGNVSLVETKANSAVFTVKPKGNGAYSAADPEAIVARLIEAKVSVDGWALWLDGDFGSLNRAKGKYGSPYTAAQFAKAVKAAETVELVAVRRKWPSPVLKLTTADAVKASPAANPNAPREL